jgi:hypothetical protein
MHFKNKVTLAQLLNVELEQIFVDAFQKQGCWLSAVRNFIQ